MLNPFQKPRQHLFRSAFLIATLFGATSVAMAQSPDANALALLKSSTDFLKTQAQFTVTSESVLEVVLENGQKIQFDNAASLALKRPNKLKAERVGDLVDQQMYYNGKTFTLFNPSAGMYATEAMPATLDAMLDKATADFDIVAPASDLIYSNAFDRLTQSATAGFIVGKAMIDGTLCTHLAFRTPGTDWQIWIADGAKPLPHKFVVTSVDVDGSPQFEVRLKKWNLAPNLSDAVFEFKAPANAQKINFISATK
jgi:hypothetical protein